jgi:diguanylate cyclase (GGDEF)-like protein
VNNTFGHTTGDLVLGESSRRLVDLVGNDNIVGRIGGDEFALLVRSVPNQKELELFAEKVITLVKKPILIHGIIVQLNCSVGAMLLDYQEAKIEREYDKILNHTEFVLSQAKNTQKGGYCIFNNIIGEEADRQAKMQHSLESAISNHELLIYFQAQYDLREKKIIGFESLVRWDSKQFGMVSPVQFIPLAEKTGCIKDIGRFVIDKTFAFAKEYEDTDLCISFNCSPIELMQADFVDYVKERFDYYHLRWNSVAIEITESCLINHLMRSFKSSVTCAITVCWFIWMISEQVSHPLPILKICRLMRSRLTRALLTKSAPIKQRKTLWV